jgi:hypothetical protein
VGRHRRLTHGPRADDDAGGAPSAICGASGRSTRTPVRGMFARDRPVRANAWRTVRRPPRPSSRNRPRRRAQRPKRRHASGRSSSAAPSQARVVVRPDSKDI